MAGSEGPGSRPLETAAEFCRLVQKDDLLSYLGLPDDVSSADAMEALRKKRRFMQGMQANPKYKAEAVAFIKSFGAFTELMAVPSDYVREARRQSERTHVPVLEMTIRGALRGGAPTAEQITWLERNATELGVSPGLFRETLDRVLREAGYAPEAKRVAPGQTIGPFLFEDERPEDPWATLGVSRTASLAEIEEAWRDLRVTADPARLEQLDRAWRLLNEAPKTRAGRKPTDPLPEPSIHTAQTLPLPVEAPPARRGLTDPGGTRSPGAPTAPPVRDRQFAPARAGALQSAPTVPPPVIGAARSVTGTGELKTLIITGATKPTFEGQNPLQLSLGTRRQILTVRLAVSPNDASEVRFESSAPWAIPPSEPLEPNRGEHDVEILLDPRHLHGNTGVATITAAARGERGQLTIAVERRQTGAFFTPFLLGIIVAVVCVLVVSMLILLAVGVLR